MINTVADFVMSFDGNSTIFRINLKILHTILINLTGKRMIVNIRTKSLQTILTNSLGINVMKLIIKRSKGCQSFIFNVGINFVNFSKMVVS